MNGLDVLSIVGTIVGLSAAMLSTCRWLAPTRRLRDLDDLAQRVEDLISSIGEQDMFTYQSMVVLRNAEERLFRCAGE
jgi:hypothetical protein